jgi:quercetin dioxygenase-like cupin family protein
MNIRPAVVVVTTLCLVAFARGDARIMPSTVYDWNATDPTTTDYGSLRKLFQAPTATLDELECHVTTLAPGLSAHAPHRHPEEEIVIVKQGSIEALSGGEWRRAGAGSVVFQASNSLHAIRNPGATTASYFVVRWRSPGQPRAVLRPLAPDFSK